MIKLIASDLDGTILQNGAQSVPAEIINAIHQLYEKGIVFVAASGRTYNNIQLLFQDVKVPMMIIAENGGVYELNGELCISDTHTRETLETLLPVLREDPSCQLAYACAETTYVEKRDMDAANRMMNLLRYHVTIVDDLLKLDRLPIKLAIYNAKGIAYSERKYKDLFEGKVNVMTSGNFWLDLMPFHVNKGVALQHITEHLDLSPNECIAFGDQWNDAEMLSFVGTSYAMANAAPGIADLCTNTTDSVLKELGKYL